MKRSLLSLALIVLGVLVLSMPARAWDDVGHKLTAYIAWQSMTPDVRSRVIEILRAAPEDSQLAAFYMSYGSQSKAEREREFFVMTASWADFIKDRGFPVRYKTYSNSNWHYSDTFWHLDNGKVVMDTDVEKNGLAMDKLDEFNKLIRSTASDKDKAIAVAWLIHIIGDIHQPLHVSAKTTKSFPKGDQGGNLFFLTPKGTPRDEQINLHGFWDSIIDRTVPNTKDECDAAYLDPLGEKIIAAYSREKLKSDLEPGEFSKWKDESLDIATTVAYRNIEFFKKPSDDYQQKAFRISERQIALAGYRIADLFNSAFGTASVKEAEGKSQGK
ncbi:MAG: S1/P1 nuclease [Acidobacteria bacterium]|nr:S1/P1 nuclease [Acidobacteriota bacterium]